MTTCIERVFEQSYQTTPAYQEGVTDMTRAIKNDYYNPPTPLLKQEAIRLFANIDSKTNDYRAGVYDALHAIMADLNKRSTINYVYMSWLDVYTQGA